MNRGGIGCFTEGACEVGLENRQDAQTICVCGKVVNYICGEESGRSVNIRTEVEHSTNKRNRNRIRRSLMRRIYTAEQQEGLTEGLKERTVEELKAQLLLYPKRQKRRKRVQTPLKRPSSKEREGHQRRTGQRGCKHVRYPTFGRSHTKVCTKSKSKGRKYNVGTGRGQKRSRGLKHLRGHHSVRVRDIRKLLLQYQELSKSDPNVPLPAPDLQEGSCQSEHDDPGTESPQGVIRLDIEMPGSEMLELEVDSSATIQDIKLHVAGKLPPELRTFELHFDGLVLSSGMSCEPFHESQLQVALSLQGGGRQDKSPSKKAGRKRGKKGSSRRAARNRTADILSKLSYEETTEIMSSRKRPQEDPDLKEVEELVESRWWVKESNAAAEALEKHRQDHKKKKVPLYGTLNPQEPPGKSMRCMSLNPN